MDNLERIYEAFRQQPEEETNQRKDPRQKDAERLEEEIQGIYENRRFLNKTISTFFAVTVSSAGINLITRIGLPMTATGTIGGLVLAVFLGNTISKIKLEGNRPKIDGEFIGSSIQTIGVGASFWAGCKEQREIERTAKVGKERFIEEVKTYEKKPQMKESPLENGASIAGLLLLLAIGILLIAKGDKKRFL